MDDAPLLLTRLDPDRPPFDPAATTREAALVLEYIEQAMPIDPSLLREAGYRPGERPRTVTLPHGEAFFEPKTSDDLSTSDAKGILHDLILCGALIPILDSMRGTTYLAARPTGPTGSRH